jgi:multidrug resistance efflux pump
MTSPAPIPIPWRERWRSARLRFIPAVIFIAVVFFLALMWKEYASVPRLTGQAEVIAANVSCYKPGMLAQLFVNRFQKVKAGDPVGQVQVTDPKIFVASLAVIEADIDMLRAGLQPVAARQRLAMEYSDLRLDWMRQRAQLAMAKANLQLAEADFHRTEELYKDNIVSGRFYDQAKTTQERSQNEVEELTRLVEEQGRNLDQLQLTNTAEISKVTDDPLKAAIAVQDAKLRLKEAELNPIIVRAAVDGMVDVIYHRVGEAVTEGEPIVGIAPFNAVRIIGYLRPPILQEPKLGARVEVRTRGPRGQVGSAEIIEVGSQFEPLPPALQIPVRLTTTELGLPLSISVPPSLKIRPGELVDLKLVR